METEAFNTIISVIIEANVLTEEQEDKLLNKIASNYEFIINKEGVASLREDRD